MKVDPWREIEREIDKWCPFTQGIQDEEDGTKGREYMGPVYLIRFTIYTGLGPGPMDSLTLPIVSFNDN